MKKTIVISLGGSTIIPHKGIDIAFLKKFRTLILRYVRRKYRFIIVTGGGTVARDYQSALRKLGCTNAATLDWIGIRVSRVNAHLLRMLFGKYAAKEIIMHPDTVTKALWRSNTRVVFAGGEKPGQSTDHVAVQLAIRFGADTIFNLSNVRYVYDADPARYARAKPLSTLSWKDLQTIVGTHWTPGANVPFDPRATALAARQRLCVLFLYGNNLHNVDRALSQKSFRGSRVS